MGLASASPTACDLNRVLKACLLAQRISGRLGGHLCQTASCSPLLQTLTVFPVGAASSCGPLAYQKL